MSYGNLGRFGNVAGQWQPKINFRYSQQPSRVDVYYHDSCCCGGYEEPKMSKYDKWTLGLGIAGSIMAGLNDIIGSSGSSSSKGGVVANTPEAIHQLHERNLTALAGNSGAIILSEPDGKFRVYTSGGEAKTNGPVDYETALEAVRNIRTSSKSQSATGTSGTGSTSTGKITSFETLQKDGKEYLKLNGDDKQKYEIKDKNGTKYLEMGSDKYKYEAGNNKVTLTKLTDAEFNAL